jgi:hypothetical protein
MVISSIIRKRLETQGFVGLDAATLAEVGPWLRFSPALCTILMGIGTATASTTILWALAPIAALGAIFRSHPFDLIYNYGIRHLTHTRRLPPNGAPRRFACGMAAVWLAATAFAFGKGAMAAGYILGGVLTAVAAIVSVSHFCIPSTIYGLLFGRPAASSVSSPA